MSKLAAFDLEIIRTIPDGTTDWWEHAPFGISCLAVALSDSPDAIVWSGDGALGKAGARAAVTGLEQLIADGYQLVGFNSCGFDMRVLAEESGMHADCRVIAYRHIDLYFHIFCGLGYGPGLDRLAKGLGLPGKPEGVNGALAPQMWAEGQRQAVIDYCVSDVRTTLAIAQTGAERGGVEWTTSKGKHGSFDLPKGWGTVQQALRLPEPDTSWMAKPRTRKDITGWMG